MGRITGEEMAKKSKMANIIEFIISNIAHTVYVRFTVFSNFWKLLFVFYILAYSKFLL